MGSPESRYHSTFQPRCFLETRCEAESLSNTLHRMRGERGRGKGVKGESKQVKGKGGQEKELKRGRGERGEGNQNERGSRRRGKRDGATEKKGQQL